MRVCLMQLVTPAGRGAATGSDVRLWALTGLARSAHHCTRMTLLVVVVLTCARTSDYKKHSRHECEH
eukprot:SAG31_NODE_25292_length_464_cov_0.991781_2_plen_66_part_01